MNDMIHAVILYLLSMNYFIYMKILEMFL